MGTVVAMLREGATFSAAARKVGVCAGTVHKWRRLSPAFAAACGEARAESDRPLLVVPGSGGRKWQLRRDRRHRFTTERKQIFLEHFAATLDLKASAEAAGICFATVYEHRRRDPEFARAWLEALEMGVARLEAEGLRQRLEAMERIRVSGDLHGEGAAAEYERSMGFVRDWRRRLDGGKSGGPPPTKWNFEESLGELEKQLKAFGARIERAEDEEREGGGDAGG
jgi:hypothetical protein